MNFTTYVVLRVLTSAAKSCLNASSNVHLARRSSEHLNVSRNNSRLLSRSNQSCFQESCTSTARVAQVVVALFCIAVSCGGIRVPANLKWGTAQVPQNHPCKPKSWLQFAIIESYLLTLCETLQTLASPQEK
eukprot:s1350_g8.t1